VEMRPGVTPCAKVTVVDAGARGGKTLSSSSPDLRSRARTQSGVCCLDLSRLVTYKFLMLGETIKEARIRKGLTQARLAKMAGVSRRHLAALEKGANVSILVLRKVTAVLELNEI